MLTFSTSQKWLEDGATVLDNGWMRKGKEGGDYTEARDIAHHLGIESRFCSEACLMLRWGMPCAGEYEEREVR